MSTRDAIEIIHTLEDYGLVIAAADDDEISDALTELAMCDGGEDGE